MLDGPKYEAPNAKSDCGNNGQHDKEQQREKLSDQERWLGLGGSQRPECRHFLEKLHN